MNNEADAAVDTDTHRRWRAEDLEQRALENARFLWSRNVEQNRRNTVNVKRSACNTSNCALQPCLTLPPAG